MSDSRNLLGAVAAVQAAMETVPKNETANAGGYSYKYAGLDTIVEAIRPLLAAEKLVWMTFPGRDERGEPVLRYELAHAPTGERIEGFMPLMIQQATPQGLGSALTYARRYSLCAVLNLVADDDDDGKQGSNPPQSSGSYGKPPADQPPPSRVPSQAQKRMIHALIDEHEVSRRQLEAILAEKNVELTEGWMDRLTRGQGGTASWVIEQLQMLPLLRPSGRLQPHEEEQPHDRTTSAAD